MRVRRIAPWLVLAALAGCYSPNAPSGVPCASVDSPQRCPAGQQCVLVGGVEVCSGEPGDDIDAGEIDRDRDGDGVIDRDDNCPDHANPTQGDEDSDATGDVCDPCPPFDDNSDADGDGVGDACDPHPEVAGDELIAFEGFAGELGQAWTVTGTFSIAGGDGVANAVANHSTLVTIASPAAQRVEIRAAAQLVSITATGLTLGANGLVDRLADGTDDGIVCQLSALVDGDQQQLRIFDTFESKVIDTAPHAFAAGTASELRLRRNGTSYACRATNPSLELAGSAAFAPAAPRIGLRARNAVVRYQWVMVVSSP
jgi:hypothetical protein